MSQFLQVLVVVATYNNKTAKDNVWRNGGNTTPIGATDKFIA